MVTASSWLVWLAAALLVAPGARVAAARPWLVVFLATLALALLLPGLSSLVPRGPPAAATWQWVGPLLVLAGTLCVAWVLVRRAGMTWAEMGVTWTQHAGSLRPALAVTALAVLLNLALSRASGYTLPGVSMQTWLYQASLPGLVEETLFRGVLLALLDRAFTARRMLAGADFGYGALVTTAAFGVLHGFQLGSLLGVWPAALLYLWLRARTGSLVMPVLGHNLWNLSLLVGHF
jgi:membrane protease YdiL (CAAX protease family)